HVGAIPLGGFNKRTRQQTHLRHREGLDLGRDIAARELDRVFEWRDFVERAIAALLRLGGAGVGIRRTGGRRSLLLCGKRSRPGVSPLNNSGIEFPPRTTFGVVADFATGSEPAAMPSATAGVTAP